MVETDGHLGSNGLHQREPSQDEQNRLLGTNRDVEHAPDNNDAGGRVLHLEPEDLKDLGATTEPRSDVADFVPVDGGVGWLVCFASFWANGTLFGILNTFGIIYVELLEEFAAPGEDIAFKTCEFTLIYILLISWNSLEDNQVHNRVLTTVLK